MLFTSVQNKVVFEGISETFEKKLLDLELIDR